MGMWKSRLEGDNCHAEGHVMSCRNRFPCTGVRSRSDSTEVTSNPPLCGGAGPGEGVGVVGGSGMACELVPAVEAVIQRSVISLSLSLNLSVSLSLFSPSET